ncbi:hypothetical protein [Bacillus bombysepticus]|uniref:hypothetical protein n=1 Tax=Bacillus bombysepticus TaxID=658666 RepID=UPI00301AA660
MKKILKQMIQYVDGTDNNFEVFTGDDEQAILVKINEFVKEQTLWKIVKTKEWYMAEENEVLVNPGEWNIEHIYLINLFEYDPTTYIASGFCEQDAVDSVIDYLEEQGDIGLFLTEEEMKECDEEGREYYTGGNHCHSFAFLMIRKWGI